MKKIVILLLSFVSFLAANDRIIALSPAINEIIYALDSGDKIVGNTLYCKYPKSSIDKPKVGGYFNPSLEKILTLKPSLVVMQTDDKSLSKKLNKLGIKTKYVKIDKLESIKNSILDLGTILNKQAKAVEIVKNIQDELNKTKNILSDKKILFVIGHYTNLDKRVFVTGDNLYFEDIIKYSGNQNAFQSQKKGQPILNMENIIQTNPDIVILLSPYIKEKNLTKKQLIAPWLKLPINAAKKQTIYIIDKEYAGISSHRLAYFLRDFKEILQDAKTR
jgi:iron complex transport system substrate-binding protein